MTGRRVPNQARKPSESCKDGRPHLASQAKERMTTHVLETPGDDRFPRAAGDPRFDRLVLQTVEHVAIRLSLMAAKQREVRSDNPAGSVGIGVSS